MRGRDVLPFQLSVPDSVLDDLRQRLLCTRLPDEPPLAPWSTGTSVPRRHALAAAASCSHAVRKMRGGRSKLACRSREPFNK